MQGWSDRHARRSAAHRATGSGEDLSDGSEEDGSDLSEGSLAEDGTVEDRRKTMLVVSGEEE